MKITRRLQLAKGLCEMSHNNYEHAARIFANIPCDSWDNEVSYFIWVEIKVGYFNFSNVVYPSISK